MRGISSFGVDGCALFETRRNKITIECGDCLMQRREGNSRSALDNTEVGADMCHPDKS